MAVKRPLANYSGTIEELRSGDTTNEYPIFGTWTPTVVGVTSAGTATYTLRDGNYTRIGDRVLFDCRLNWTGHTGTGSMRISGLPFTVGKYAALSAVSDGIARSAGGILTPEATEATTYISMFADVAGALVSVAMDAAAYLNISGQYRV